MISMILTLKYFFFFSTGLLILDQLLCLRPIIMSLSDEKTFSPTPIHSIPSYAPSFCLLFFQCHNESFMIVLLN